MLAILFTMLATIAAFASASDPKTPQLLLAVSNSSGYAGLYLTTYDQGGGFNDAALTANRSRALGGAFLNATADVTKEKYYLDFNTTISACQGKFDIYHAQMHSDGQYSSMNLLTVNIVEAPDDGFSFDSAGRLGWQNSTDFAACEWTHAVRPLDRIDDSLDILVCTGEIQTMRNTLCRVGVFRSSWLGRIKCNLACRAKGIPWTSLRAHLTTEDKFTPYLNIFVGIWCIRGSIVLEYGVYRGLLVSGIKLVSATSR
jgi:hypothetical protein